MSAEEAYQDTMADIAAQPQSFWEGFTSS